MKKKIYIFLIFIFGIIHIPLYSSNIYTYEVGSFYTSTDSVSLGNYVIDNYTLGELFGSSLQSANYKLNSGYLNYLDANYLPAYLKIYNDNKFVFSRNSFSNDTALLLVSDFDSEPVRYIKLDVEVVDKPIGATDDTFVIIETDKNGLASLNYRAGVLSGSYILKVSYFDVGSEYLCYSTNETVIPAKQWRMIGLNKISMNNTNVDFVFNNVKPEYIY
ncbi:MAG TPA: hypothetical protein PLM75_03125, partial [bacterium]|nr:hypothetical protein [bacterium]